MLSCFIHCRRLVARTLPFQGGEAGSIPVDSTKQLGAVVGYGVALQASCLEGFDSLGLHQFISMKRYQVAYTVWGRVV